MDSNNFSKREFTHALLVNCDRDQLFFYVSTAAGLCKWFLGTVEFRSMDQEIISNNIIPKVGSSFIWTWLEKSLSISGKVLDVQNQSITYTFGDDFTVEMKAESFGKRSKLILVQKKVEQDPKTYGFGFINCAVCWTFFMTNLKSVIEFGNDLRETEEQDENLVNR